MSPMLQGIDLKALVQRAVEKGQCSAPRMTPPITNNQIFRLRHSGVKVTPVKKNNSRLPDYIINQLSKFTELHDARFSFHDFQNFLTRAGVNLLPRTTSTFLRLAAAENLIKIDRKGGCNFLNLYKKKEVVE